MPDFKKRLVVVTDEQPTVITPTLTPEQKDQQTQKLLGDLQTKVESGKATRKEIELHNYNVKLSQEFAAKMTEISAQADNYAPKAIKLFNEDFSKLGNYQSNRWTKPNQQSFTPSGVRAEGMDDINSEEWEKQKERLYNQSKFKFQQEANKKLSNVENYIKTKNYQGLREIANYLMGPGKTGIAEAEDYFYNKDVFDKTNRKTANYLLNFARAFEIEKIAADRKINLASLKDDPQSLKEIGRELYAKEIGTELYGEFKPEVHLAEAEENPDNLIDYKATQLAAQSLEGIAQLDYRKKLAEFSRLKLHAEKTKNDKGLKEAEAAFLASEKYLENLKKFDVDEVLKKNFKDTYFSQKDDEEQTQRRAASSGSVFELPIKAYYAAKAGGKATLNNLVDAFYGVRSLFSDDYGTARLSYLADINRFDKTGYTIGIDENGNPVESSKFRWVDSQGKAHYNGYAIIEGGIPVAEQMLETIFFSKGLGLLGKGVAKGASSLGRFVIGGDRLANFGAAALKTPLVGSTLKSTSTLLKNPEIYNRLNTFASVYATTYPRIYMEEYDNFKNAEDAQDVASLRALVESISESYVPNTPDLFKRGARGIGSGARKTYTQDLSAGLDEVILETFPGISNKLLKGLAESAITKRALGIAGDVFQEGVIEEEASLLGNYFVDKYAKSKNKEYIEQNELSLKNILETAVESTAAMLLTAPFMGGGSKRAQKAQDNESIVSARWRIANNPDFYKSVIASRLKAGEITQEKAVQDIAKVDQYSQALKNLPIQNLSSIRDMKTLLENKDVQYKFFSDYLQREALLEYTPTEEQLPAYREELQRLDAELYKTKELADKYDSLSLADKRQIIRDSFQTRLDRLTKQDDFSPASLAGALAQAQKDLKTNKNRVFSTELEEYVTNLAASEELAKEKLKNFITNNNSGLTSEQRNYKASLLGINSPFFSKTEVQGMYSSLQEAEVDAYRPFLDIQDENEFIEVLARNYVTSKTNERPLTVNGEVSFYGLLQDQYINNGLFTKFTQGLEETEAAKKQEELKNRFWTRVVELKQNQEPGQVFPEVGTTPETPSQKTAKEGEVPTTYKDSVQKFREAAERGMSEDMGMIRDEIVTQLTSEPTIESLTQALAGIKSVFIETDLDKVISDLQQNKTESLVEFLEEAGATPKEINSIVSKLPKAEKTATKTQETKETKTAEETKAEIKRRRQELEKQIEEAEKAKAKELQPLIEEKERLENEIAEIEKDTKGSETSTQEIEDAKKEIVNLRNEDGSIPDNKISLFNKLNKKIRFLQKSFKNQIVALVDSFSQLNNLSDKDIRVLNRFVETTDFTFEEIIQELEERNSTTYKRPSELEYFEDNSTRVDKLNENQEAVDESINERSKLSAEELGIDLDKVYYANELDAFVQKHGSKQTKFIWNLIKNVAEKLKIPTKFLLEGKGNNIAKEHQGEYSNGQVANRASLLTNPHVAARTIVHELVHGVTSYIIDAVKYNKTEVLNKLTPKQINAAKKLSNLLRELQSDSNTKDFYGSKNEHEILAELTHDGFTDALKNKELNFVERFFDYILDILGISTNAYDEALGILKNMIENPIDYVAEGFVSEGVYYSKSENTKLDQLKQQLAEVNKKISEVENKFDKQISDLKSKSKSLLSKEQSSTQKTSVSTDAKSDIEKQKQAYRKMTKGTPINKDAPKGPKIGDKYDDRLNIIVVNESLADNFDPKLADNNGEGYEVISKIKKYGEMENGVQTKAPEVEIIIFNNKADADRFFAEEKVKLDKYIADAELEALESTSVEDFLSSEEATTPEVLETISTEEFVAIQEKQTEEEVEAEETYEKQLSVKQETIQSNVIEDVRENYVYLGITDTNYKDETRLTDENTAFLFSVVDNIDNSVNSADMRSLGYNLVLHTGRDILNRLGISIEPKETYEEFKEQFRVNGILILSEESIKYLQRAASNIDSIKLALMTNELGEPLFFDKTGERVEEGTPFVSLIGQTFEKEKGKGGKTLDDKFRASMPPNAQIVPLSKFVNGRTIVKKPLTAKESNDLIIHLEKGEKVDTGGIPFTLYPGVIYLKTNNPKFPYRSTWQRQNTPETAEEVMTLIEAYNESKLNPEESTLPEYFSAMSPTNFIKYIHNYAFIPKNSIKYSWGITLVRKEGENAATLIRIYNNNNKSTIISREEAVNLIASTSASSSRDFFNGDLVFRPFYIEEGKVKVEKAINFKSWFGNFAKSGARVDGVANRNLAFAKQDVKELSGKPTTETVKPALTNEQIVSMFTAEPTVEAPAPVSTDAKADIERKKSLSQELISFVWDRLAKKGISNADSVVGTRDTIDGVDFNKFWSNVTKEDLQNLRKSYETQKQNQLDLYNKFKGAFDPSTGTITSSDTSFFDNKIKNVDAELAALEGAKPAERAGGFRETFEVTSSTEEREEQMRLLEEEKQAKLDPLKQELAELSTQLAQIEKLEQEKVLNGLVEENVTEEEIDAIAQEEGIEKEAVKEKIKEEVNNSINNVKPSSPLGAVLQKVINKILKAFLLTGLIVSLNFTNLSFSPSPYKVTRPTLKESVQSVSRDSSYNLLTLDGKLVYDQEVKLKKSFILVDKPTAQAYIYDSTGSLIKSFPVLLGKTVGDEINTADVTKNVAVNAYTTPGRYVLDNYVNSRDLISYENRIFGLKNGNGIAIHQTSKNQFEKRTKALNTPSKEDNRLSWGCVNVSKENWDAYIKDNIKAGDYIIITRDFQDTSVSKIAKPVAKPVTKTAVTTTTPVEKTPVSKENSFAIFIASLAALVERKRKGENIDAELEALKATVVGRVAALTKEVERIENDYNDKIKRLAQGEVLAPARTPQTLNKLPNDIREEFKGKLIYATPGAGKTTLSLGMQGVIDSDELMIAEMQKRHPEFLGKPGESIQEFIFRYVKIHDHKSEINDIVLGKIKQLTAQGATVLTGTTAFIKDSDFAFTLPLTNPRILTRFGNEQTAKTFSGKEAEEIRKSGKTSEVLNDNLEFFLTKKGYTDPVPVESPVPTRRGTRGKGGNIELNRAKEYRNQITKLQNKIAEEWVNTVGKKIFGADRFIFEQTLINPEAYATWSLAAIRLFADANFADAYHESWHEFTQMYLTPEQRETLYKEGRKIYGEKLTNLEIEEKFAEDFRQFMLTGVMPEAITQYKESKTILQKIADFLRNFFTNKQTVDRYFERLAKGKVGAKVGKPEFVTLNSAKALYLTNENNELAPLSFQESKRYLDMIDEVFVMLGNNIVIEAAIKKWDTIYPGVEVGPDYLKGLSYLNLMYTPNNIESIYENIYNYLAALENEAFEKNDIVAIEEFSKIFGLQGENAELIFNYHKQNSSLFTPEMVEGLTDLQDIEDEELSDTNLIKSELGAKSQKEIAPPIVLNIIRSIPKVDKDGEVIENSLTGASIFGDFTENWNILTNVLSGSTNYDEMLQRINDLSVDYPQFGYLLQRLPEKINRDSDQQLRNLFFNTLSMEKVNGVIGTFNDKGQFTVNNTSTLDTKRIRDAWSLMFSTEKGKPFKKPSAVTGNFVLDPRLFDAYPKEPETAEDVLAFLQAIGFNYSQKAQEAFLKDFNKVKTKFHYVYEKLKEVTLYSTVEVANPFLAIRENHTNATTGETVKGKGYDLDYLIEIEAKNNLAFANDMIQLADNTNQYITTPHTYQTKVIAALNDPKYKYFEDLIADYPELDPSKNVGLKGSAYLEYLFDFTTDVTVQGKIKHKRNFKNGKPVTIEVVSMNGVKAPEDTEYIFNKKTIDLEDPEKHLGDIRTLLSPFGRVEENNRIGDKSTTRGTYLSSEDYFLYNKDFYYQNEKLSLSPEIWNIFYNYLKAETSVTDRTSFSKTFNDNKFFEGVPQLAYFSEILSPELRSDIYKFFQNNTVEDFESSPLRNSVKKEMNSWFYSLAESSEELLSKFDSAEKTDYQVSKQELFMYHVLSMISRIEQYKLFNFHPYYYKNAKDVEKRISAFNAAGNYAVVDKANLDYTKNTLANKLAFEEYAKANQIEVLTREGTDEDITYLVFKDTAVDSTTAKDNKEDYGIHYDSYVNTKADVQDAASIITLDFFKKFYSMSTGLSLEMKKELDRQSTIWTNMLELKVNSKNQEARENLLKALNEGPHYIFSVKKLQYAGPGYLPAEVVPVFHKYSNKVMLPSEMVDNEEMFQIAVKLYASNADYGVFKTGTKIAETVEPVALFDKGKVIPTGKKAGVISLKYLKEQQEVEHKKDFLIIFATQFRKLLFKDITTQEEKDLFNVFKAYLGQLTNYDKAKFLDKIEDKEKAVEFLIEQLDKKNVSSVTKDLIRLKEDNKELEYAIDSLIERTAAESAVTSAIRKSIVRQKFNGTQFVQFPVSLVRPDKQLKFYRIEDDKIASAECIISFSRKYYPLLNLPFDKNSTIGKFDKDGNIINRYQALRRLNQKLADESFRKKYEDSLTLAGVRIPVQGYNSMEKMQIVEFLPEESGSVMLVPDELVVKSGGDFDIDKLFMYEPILNKNTGLMLTDENSSKGRLAKLPNKGLLKTKEELEREAQLTKLSVEEYMKKTGFVLGEESEVKAARNLQERLEKEAVREERSLIQNKLLDIIKKRLSQKQIFEDLIEPNNVKDLDKFAKVAPDYLQGDVNKIAKEPSTGRNMWSNIINPLYQLYVYQLAHAVDMVGIAAKMNVFQTSVQDAQLEIVNKRDIDLIFFDVHKNAKGNIELWKIYDIDNVNKISQIISQFISGSVDVVKNDNILKNNVNPNTVSVALYLSLMGVRYKDINSFLTDELIYMYSKGQSFESLLQTYYPEQYKEFKVYSKSGKFSNYDTAVGILETSGATKETILTDSDLELARLAQFIILENQQSNYITPLVTGVDYDTQSFQNFENITEVERNVKKVYESGFFNQEAVAKLVNSSTVSSFRVSADFIRRFEDMFPISANKGLTDFMLNSYVGIRKSRISYENYSRRFKNALLTSMLESNMSEFAEYANYLRVDPTVKNIEDMLNEIKKEAAEYGASIPLIDSIFFTGNLNSDYISPGILKNNNDIDVNAKKEEFMQGLAWDTNKIEDVPEQFRNKVRNFFRIFAYTGIISTQLNKAHGSFLEIIPEEIYTPVVDKYVKALSEDISLGTKSSYLAKFNARFKFNNPDIFARVPRNMMINPSLKFYRNYNLNIPEEEVSLEYEPIVERPRVERITTTTTLPTQPSTQAVSQTRTFKDEEYHQAYIKGGLAAVQELIQKNKQKEMSAAKQLSKEVDMLTEFEDLNTKPNKTNSDNDRLIELYVLLKNSKELDFEYSLNQIGLSTQPSTTVNPLVAAGVKPTDMYGNAAKDIQMAFESTQFIGFGTIMKEGNVSSTDKYTKAWGTKANTGVYTADDVIMVSGSGNFGRGGVDKRVEAQAITKTLSEKYKPLLEQAIAAGASFRVGNQYSKGNLSDELVAKYLSQKGYIEEKLDGYSRWTSLNKVETLKENLPAVEPPSLKEQLNTLEAERKELLEIQKESAPYIPELIIADNLPKIQTESAKKETGLNVGTKQDINPSLISTDGMTVEKAAEYLQQDYFNGVQYQKMDLQDIRNAIIEILSMGKAAFVQTNTPLTSELEDVNQEIASVKAKIEVEAKSEELDPNKGGIPVDTLTRQLSIDFNSFESQSSDPEIDKKIIDEANNLPNDESACNRE